MTATDQEVKAHLYEIIKIYLPQDYKGDKIKPSDHLMNDLGINSSHLVDIALDVEDEFEITLNESDMENMQSVQEAFEIVRSKIST
ncbi:MAG: phosphopantetheine-binding protein [Nonlabens sp.]